MYTGSVRLTWMSSGMSRVASCVKSLLIVCRPIGFKEDADFARFVSMGAVGTAAVADDLREQHGHRPIELERYAMANKVWQTKVKRLRLPDLVCTRCGLRVESMAKSKLGLVL